MVPTPILDREQPAPAATPKPEPRNLKYLDRSAWIVGGLLGLAAAGPWFPAFRGWVEAVFTGWFRAQAGGMGIIGVVFNAAVAYYAAVVIHEVGHVVSGLLAGFRFQSMRIGPIIIRSPLRLSRHPASGEWLTGHAELSPGRVDHFRWRMIAFAVGGPAANVVTALLLLGMPGSPSLLNGALAGFSLVLGIGTLVPASTPTGHTDGRDLAWLLGRDPRGDRRLAILRLFADLAKGIRADRSDPELFRMATAVRDASVQTVVGHLFAFGRALLVGQRDEAGNYLEAALEYSNHAPPELREAIWSDAATFQARQRKRVDLAEQWLSEIGQPPLRPWNRARPEAAILEAKGDLTGALLRLDDVERAALAALPPGGMRDVVLAELRDWRSEIEVAGAAA